MIFITRREHFSCSHKLENPDLNLNENKEIFGKCNNFHGHNYYLEVTLTGEVNPKSGYVMDLKKLKEIIHSEILNKIDHQYLNELEMFKGIIPTTENMAMVFWKILKEKIKGDGNPVKLFSIKLYETEKNYVEFRGE
ncbi:MAG: 6-carboxytetrahydropterin synthase [Ignavibacteria bacterium]|nr:6-carboxytetrahydropterin synthase [Ignavibacteria bacterium]HCN37923.1 6-pyruvoyl tetrahydrobiopterin synthase [Bacteroidota bacterium]